MREKSYEYFQSQPCVFLKLAKDADWMPKFYNESKLPAAMPSDLQDIVKNYVKNDKKFAVSFSFSRGCLKYYKSLSLWLILSWTTFNSIAVNNFISQQFVWVSCDGKSEADKKNIGAIRYLPRQGFPGYFYPCSSNDGCSQPIVAIQFLRPKGEMIIW